MIIRNMALFALRNGTHLGRFAVAAVFLLSFLVSGAWAACQVYSQSTSCGGCTQDACYIGPTSNGIYVIGAGDYNYVGVVVYWSYEPILSPTCTIANNRLYGTWVSCDTQCEKDSVQCVNDGGTWSNTGAETCSGYSCTYCDEQCQCEEQGMLWTGTECIDDTTVCADMRSDCAGLGGDFTGSVIVTGGDKCCSGVCDLCGSKSMNRIANLKRDECCSQLQAPPAENVFCSTPIQSGCGFTTSQFQDPSSGEWKCQDPNLDQATMDRYVEQCSAEVSSSSEGPGPGSSSGGTSSEGGASSAGEYGDCQECPWLDSILDTLHSIHYTIDDIKTCMQVPGACPGFDFSVDFSEMPVFGFDTAFRKYLKPLMDSTLKVDSLQLKALLKLDTNQLKLLKVDSASLKNDTVTWTKFDALGNVIDTSVHSQNDTTRKWFKRIADSIGVSTDSLAAHIDSIIRHIPDSVLDSIVKYQQYASDNFDSVLFGTGKGFSLVDSLIDSSVKYFKESNQKWNEYISMYGDSMQKIHEEFIDLPGRNASAIGSALGYGDTATSTLRGDLEGIRGAIEGLGDGIGSGVAGALDSAIGSGSGADTAGVGYGWLADGDALADSIKAASGYNSLDFEADSALRDSLENAGYVCTDSTCCIGNQCVEFDSEKKIQDSLARFVAAYGDTLQQKNSEFLADSVDGMFQAVKDSLNVWNPVGIFDSTVLSTLGMKIPNTNTCPEHCSKFEVDIPFMFGTQHFTIDYGLCLGRAAFANGNVLSFLRFIIRIVVAFTCISAVMWNAARIKR